MDFARGLFEVIQQWTTYVWYCIGQLMQTPVCKPFWTGVTIALLALGALIVSVVAWKIVSYRMMLAAALKAERERARIDHEAISARSWDGDKAYRSQLGGEEIERRVREAVDQRRTAHPPFPKLVPPDSHGQ